MYGLVRGSANILDLVGMGETGAEIGEREGSGNPVAAATVSHSRTQAGQAHTRFTRRKVDPGRAGNNIESKHQPNDQGTARGGLGARKAGIIQNG